jgi:hypothetical protein
MKKTSILAACALASALLVAGQANALTLTNRGTSEQRLKITEFSDEGVTQNIVILAAETLSDVCMEGCTIALDNGEQGSFDGTEVVYIEEDHFVTTK